MVLFITNNNIIRAYNKKMTQADILGRTDAVWYDGDFDFNAEHREGYVAEYCWDGEKPIVEYVENKPYPEPEPDKLDLILEEVRKSSEDIVTETEAAYEAALNEAYAEGVNSL